MYTKHRYLILLIKLVTIKKKSENNKNNIAKQYQNLNINMYF